MTVASSTRKIQIGLETTAGTIAAATTVWRGKGQHKDAREIKMVAEDVGILVPTNRSYVSKLAAEVDMDDVPATFEQFPYIGACGIKNVVSGAADGGGSGKVYAYPFPTAAAANTIKTATLEAGDSASAEVIEYGHVSEFKLSGGAGEAVMMSAKWQGRQAAVQAFTGSIAIPTVETILFQKGTLYLDDTGGTLGATPVSNTFVSFVLNVKTGQKPLFVGDGNLYFNAPYFSDPEVTLDITFIHDATPIAGKVDWRAQTAQLVRLKFTGSTLTTAGSTYSVSFKFWVSISS
jgi:hypothetical protein